MRYALTGTPGTGKTSVSEILRKRGHKVVDLTQFIKENGLREDYDPERDTYDVDTDRLDEALKDYDDCIFEGHLSHFLTVDSIIVLRCSPERLSERLKARGYSDSKVKENVEAEILDVILFESVESGVPVSAVDTTDSDPEITARAIEDIMKGKTDSYPPDGISWAEEMDRWL